MRALSSFGVIIAQVTLSRIAFANSLQTYFSLRVSSGHALARSCHLGVELSGALRATRCELGKELSGHAFV